MTTSQVNVIQIPSTPAASTEHLSEQPLPTSQACGIAVTSTLTAASAEHRDEQLPASAVNTEQLLDLARNGKMAECLQHLSQEHAASNLRDQDGATFAHWAALHGDGALLGAVHAHGGSIDVSITATGMTPMHWACTRGHVHIVAQLHGYGVSVEAVDVRKTTPLMVATQHGYMPLVRWLLGRGVDAARLDVDSDSALH